MRCGMRQKYSEDVGNLFSQGKAILDARYRYEYVDQDATPGKAALNHANAQRYSLMATESAMV